MGRMQLTVPIGSDPSDQKWDADGRCGACGPGLSTPGWDLCKARDGAGLFALVPTCGPACAGSVAKTTAQAVDVGAQIRCWMLHVEKRGVDLGGILRHYFFCPGHL